MGLKQSRWLVLMVTLLALGVTLRAGFWQLQRAHEREAAQQRLWQRGQTPALDNAALLALPQPQQPEAWAATAEQWRDRPVRLTGRWQPEHTVWLDNRSMDGRAGFFVVTPLALDAPQGSQAQAAWVWVQRGWVARHVQDRMRVPELHTTNQRVVLAGRLAPRLSERFALGSEGSGAIRQNLALAQMQAMSAGRSLSLVVIQMDASEEGLLRNWPSPASGADKNRAYAAQWFGMAALIMGLYVWFQLIQPRRR